jgi:hypothetical protein
MRKIALFGVVIIVTSTFFGCAKYLDKQVQGSARIMADGDTINHKEKQKMLNEIYSSAKFIPPGEVRDVRYIVEKYLPIGSSKEQVKTTLNGMNTPYSEHENKILTGSKGGNPPFVPNPVIWIELNFSDTNYLNGIKADYLYQQ